MSTPILEIAANSVASALAAEAGGATRVELCCALEVGGLTPSHATIAMARERLGIPIHVLIRPRPGDFAYDDLECETMLRDVEHCRAFGCEGVVLGALDADGDVDMPRCRGLIAAAKGMNTTFHRAFDCARDPEHALEDVIALGCGRLLTSGQSIDARSGVPLIRKLVEQSRERIVVMAGAGITPENIAAVVAASGVRELHASAKKERPPSMHRSNTSLPGLTDSTWCTDADQVHAMVEALRAVAN
ncbi:MAG: copper homeostasis protein CutC [Rhodanobacteraceae bacterium]|nr:MAG: copper homeostasis protein CutC [Rhodanobacteraceae bacterium]